MHTTNRRDILKMAAAGSSLSTFGLRSALAQAAPWPSRPITLVVGYPPGGLTDAGARFLSNGMAKALGQPVVVDNKPGASGNVAANEVLRTPGGLKLLVANPSLTINPHTFSAPSPDPTAFTPIGLILESQYILCVHPSAPARNLVEFVVWVKAESTKGFSYATAGSGGNTHLAMEYFRERMNLPKISPVPYKGSAPAIQDVVGNQVPCMLDAASLLIPFINAGKLRAIFVTGSARHPALPEVPTATELGVKDFTMTAFIGLWGPPDLPGDIVQKANAAMNLALSDPAIRNTISKNGDSVGGGTPERLNALTRENYKLWGEVARRNNIRSE
nr:tripartite tricarboxylate transporter substrate binding protein [uncultured Albidiferax sp.]